MNIRRFGISARMLALLLLLTLLLMVFLTLVLGNWVRDVIVTPALFLWWLASLLIKSTPQLIFWAILLIVSMAIVVKSLSAGRRPEQDLYEAKARPLRRQRVSYWMAQIAPTTYDDFPSGRSVRPLLVWPLQGLVLEMLAYRERLSANEVRQGLKSGELDVPPEVQAYFQNRPRLDWLDLASFFTRLKRRLRDLAIRLTQSPPPAQFDHSSRELESVVQFLEDQLEAHYDD